MNLAVPSKLDWHDVTCRRLDYAPIDDRWATCLSCGSLGAQPYSLPPLPSESSFRLLWLQPGQYEDPIRCEVHIDNLKDDPIFNAISYTWADENGDDQKLGEVILDGRPFKVTKNCNAALRRVRQKNYSTFVWIDAICIDQDNDIERGQQVKLMPQIYHQAQKVFMYIGEHDSESREALEKEGFISHNPSLSRHQWQALWRTLGTRKYFSRLWILQEIAHARQAIVLCGNSSFPWKDMTDCFTERIKWGQGQQYSILRFDRSLLTMPDMELILLDGGRPALAKDPRDKVYGLIGLLPGSRIGTVVADYTISAQQLYTQVAIQLAERYGWSAVLVRAGSKYQSLGSLPSWVPDWSFTADNPMRDISSDLPYLESNHNLLVSDNKIRLKLFRGPEEDQWFAPDIQDGKIDTRMLFEWNDHIWSHLFLRKSSWYSVHQQLRLTLEQRRSAVEEEGSSSEMKLCKATPISGMILMPIEACIFKPRDPDDWVLSDNDEDPSILDLLIPREFKSHPSGTASLDMLQREYNKRLEHQPAEDWVCHAENLWAEKYPPETLVEKGNSSNAFEMNDLMWRLLVRRYAVRAQLIDIM